MVNLLWRNQLKIVSWSDCNRVIIESILGPERYIQVSSANKAIYEYKGNLHKSLMNKKKSRGPRTEPSGSPVEIFKKDDVVLLCLVVCFLLERYDSNHDNSAPVIPYCG